MPRMRQAARVATDTALHSPGFLMLFDHELACLDALPAWQFRLFAHLVRVSNFSTGAGSTRLVELLQLLSPLQPLHGGPRHWMPNARAVLDAMRAFERAHILARDKGRSEAEGRVFFLVSPRHVKVRPRVSSRGGSPRGSDKWFSEGKAAQ